MFCFPAPAFEFAVINISFLERLQFADNEELQSEWREAKMIRKKKIVSFIKEKTGYVVSPEAMFDVQVHYNISLCYSQSFYQIDIIFLKLMLLFD